MKEEINSLKENEVYELFDLFKGKHPIGCIQVYKIKYNKNGEEIKYKAQ